MVIEGTHICICICTYKRPQLLKILLEKIQDQRTEGLFKYSIVVVDNDHKKSAEAIVANIKKKSLIKIDYCIESQKNISAARNCAVQSAHGNYLAFIDDDEYPTDNWLIELYKACHQYSADCVFGPVKPYFEIEITLFRRRF